MANQYTKKADIVKKNIDEIIWNIINATLAGAISFLSALIASGELNWKVVMVSLITSLLVAFVKFKNYWDGEQKEYSKKLFKFL
jgi:ABC-type multidrug transport system permease subunit